MKKTITYITIFTLLIFSSCTEKYEPNIPVLKELLVVESTLTNELKKQEVKLSFVRNFKEEEEVNQITNAQVWIKTENIIYNFSESNSGIYVSDAIFKAIPNTEYQLFIITEDGKEYKSTPQLLVPEAPITNLYTEKKIVNNQLGVQIYVDNKNDNNVKYFRYEFDETYKIITPYLITHDLILSNFRYYNGIVSSYKRTFTPNTIEKRICYINNEQNKIIQSKVLNTIENNIVKFPIQFISQSNSKIRDRYSILVKQYSQTQESYKYHKIIGSLGDNENVFNEIQTGFVTGNIKSLSEKGETIIGFFNVSSVSKKRIYFNYTNYNFNKPDYLYECREIVLDYRDNFPTYIDNIDWDERYAIYQFLNIDIIPYEVLANKTEYINDEPTVFTLINPECGNCSTFASNIRPGFWVD